MNSDNATIFKWLSILMVIVSVCICLFAGGIWIVDKEDVPKLKRDVKDEIDNSDSNIRELQQILDYQNFNIDVEKEIYKPLMAITKTHRNGKISALEEYGISKNTNRIAKLYESNRDIRQVGFLNSETMETAKSNRIIFAILFWLNVISGVAVILLHFMDKKLPGITVVVMNLVWLAVWLLIADDNDLYTFNLGFRYSMRITAAPIIALILSVVAMVLWIIRNKSVATAAGPVYKTERKKSNPVRPGSIRKTGKTGYVKKKAATSGANSIKCSNCGRELNPGAVFCPSCGTKYIAQVTPQQNPYEIPDNEEAKSPAKEYCPNCGAEMDSDALFCGECGYRRS